MKKRNQRRCKFCRQETYSHTLQWIWPRVKECYIETNQDEELLPIFFRMLLLFKSSCGSQERKSHALNSLMVAYKIEQDMDDSYYLFPSAAEIFHSRYPKRRRGSEEEEEMSFRLRQAELRLLESLDYRVILSETVYDLVTQALGSRHISQDLHFIFWRVLYCLFNCSICACLSEARISAVLLSLIQRGAVDTVQKRKWRNSCEHRLYLFLQELLFLNLEKIRTLTLSVRSDAFDDLFV